ncbi:AraC family transcriptional regulator [Curtobacterium sp. MCLR17_039]|uniref:helix-turn-helix transcriptional regulator n=1 Tax=Curtobacterium sp. MCLR17_039 TaxID=2175624 RepID=UPI0011B66D7F|nr:AraC family transcriptional regulator [Curtobacterium sp. MCLR17_039]
MPVLSIDFATRDAEVAATALGALYDRPEIRDVGPLFRYEQHVRGDGVMTVERHHFGGSMETTAEIADTLVSVQVHGGDFAPRGTGGVPNGSLHGLGMVHNDTLDVDFSVVSLPVSVLLGVGLQQQGAERGRLVVDGRAPRPELAGYWASVIGHAHAVTSDERAFGNDLVRAEVFRHVAAAAFQVFPVHIEPDAIVPTSATAGGVVRRAVQYIDDHLTEPISVPDIATAARVSSRGLQSAFQRELGVSPAAYVRRVRLAEAHLELLVADPDAGATVASIGLRWGFSNATRFSTAYREAYGRSPSQTLRDDVPRQGD